ncbi:MAG TPA: adenylate/guanylate cyclase domain-containing protein [Actinomycetota bacterium]|nr:adenylate/guanylate cyclase domain-containing protein [Actinomycetota bacterium]
MTDAPSLEEDPVAAGRAAIDRHAWSEGYDLLSRADREGSLAPEDIAALGEAAWWAGHIGEAISARERAYAAYLDASQPEEAAMFALILARDHLNRADGAIAGAWLSRAERLLEGLPESRAHGWLLRARARAAAEKDGDHERALGLCEEALDLATRLGDRDLLALALQGKGDALVALGRVEEGRSLQDEATVAAVSGELSPFVTGVVYCNVINACARLGDYGRAGEWTEAAKRWCERQSISGFPGVCRVHRAEIMRLRGSWADAIEEVERACVELESHGLLTHAGAAFDELGNMRLRMGDVAGATSAFRQAHELGREPQPGLALLLLAEGKIEQARTSLDRALEELSAEDRLRRAKLLPARARVALAGGDVDRACEMSEELSATADLYETTAFRAQALTTRGSVEDAEGRHEEAIATLRQARRLWSEIDLPYEAAETRALLGEAYRAAGDEGSATLELEASRATFERLGAPLDAARVTKLLEGVREEVAERVHPTFMFTDIVGSTNLVAAMGDEAWEQILAWHDRTLRGAFEAHRGEEVDHTGDGFFVAFETQEEALACAVDIQRRLAEHRKEAGFAPRIRIGVHATEASKVDGDYRGRGVHEAARVGAIGGADEIVASLSTVATTGRRFTASEPRRVELKGIPEPIDVVTVDWR